MTLFSQKQNGMKMLLKLASVVCYARVRAEATVTTTRVAFEEVVMGQRPLSDQIQRGDITIAGKPTRVAELISLRDDFEAGFPIVEPFGAR